MCNIVIVCDDVNDYRYIKIDKGTGCTRVASYVIFVIVQDFILSADIVMLR